VGKINTFNEVAYCHVRRREKAGQPEPSQPVPEEIYLGLRNQILTLDPASAGFADKPLWGCVMETGYPNGIATLVCLSDGTTSLYTSTGGGIIGGGTHERVAQENAKLLTTLSAHLSAMSPSTDDKLPRDGQTSIRALTSEGQRLFEACENDLGEGRSEMSPVFHAAHSVIGELRMIDEARR
jgi:hypothetical protein